MPFVKNVSAAYMLVTAFDYEIRNYIDIKIHELTSSDITEDLSEQTNDEIKRLKIVREFLFQRITELKP